MKTILVNAVPEETRMALMENGELAEVAVERTLSGHIVGNIYKGKIKNVLPGMQAAFVDIGLEKNAFLYIGDVADKEGAEPFTIGRELIVQVSKDAIGTKGPRLTTHLTLPGRYVVLMPTVEFTGVSRRIDGEDERNRLRDLAEKLRPEGMGIIIRTVAEGKSEEDLKKDMAYLTNLWQALAARAKRASAPSPLYRDVDLVIRIVRDFFTRDVEKFVVDSREAFSRVHDLLKYTSPELLPRLEFYEGAEDLFTCYGVEVELDKLERRQVGLKCGGSIVIDRTEALTVVDVNTGKFTGSTNLEETVFQANLDAASEIARQIRLRDIGGIIIIDFIDMLKEEHRQAVVAALAEHLKKDRTKTNLLGFTGLGLVEMTRKKARQNLEAMLHAPCPCCEGRGYVFSPETVAINVTRKLRKLVKAQQAKGRLIIQAHPLVAEALKRPGEIERLERELALSLSVEAVPSMHAEAYSILKGRD